MYLGHPCSLLKKCGLALTAQSVVLYSSQWYRRNVSFGGPDTMSPTSDPKYVAQKSAFFTGKGGWWSDGLHQVFVERLAFAVGPRVHQADSRTHLALSCQP